MERTPRDRWAQTPETSLSFALVSAIAHLGHVLVDEFDPGSLCRAETKIKLGRHLQLLLPLAAI
jgi:hypothetical protein